MPSLAAAHISVSQVYAAFDADAHRVYREAMKRSRGGVVRLVDLLGAIGSIYEEVTSQTLGLPIDIVQSLSSMRPAVNGEQTIPLSNDPPLRDVLRESYVLSPQGVTPRVLLLAAKGSSYFPQEWRPRPSPPAPRIERVPPSPLAIGPAPAEILSDWLAAQSIAVESKRREEIDRIARRVGELRRSRS